MKLKKINNSLVIIIIALFTIVAFFLRFYNLGFNDFKEEENTAVKAAAYQYYCQQDVVNCQKSTNSQVNIFY